MQIRNVKTSLLVLIGLVVLSLAFYVSAEDKLLSAENIFLDSDQDGLSDEEEKSLGTDPYNKDTDNDGYSDGVEVKTGYDPLKPAPGDKIITETATEAKPVAATVSNSNNLTQVISQKIATLSNESSESGESISQDDVQTLVDESLLANANREIQLPEIKSTDLKIQEQDYGKYSEEKAEAKRKEDFSTYIAAVFYVMSSNSPKPVTSNTTLTNIFSSISQEIMQAITLRDSSSLAKLSESGEKMQTQLMDVEVPEELVDTHIKILQFAEYSQEAEKLINPVSEDPIADVINLSQLAGLVTSLTSFASEVADKFNSYGIANDEDLQKKIQDLGIELPQDIQDELEKTQTTE